MLPIVYLEMPPSGIVLRRCCSWHMEWIPCYGRDGPPLGRTHQSAMTTASLGPTLWRWMRMVVVSISGCREERINRCSWLLTLRVREIVTWRPAYSCTIVTKVLVGCIPP